MKIFFDTEFTGLRKSTTLISIGLVSEDNRQFYAELIDYKKDQCDEWIETNVLAHLYQNDWAKRESHYIPNYHIGGKYEVAKMLGNWFAQFETVELVSDVCHYDMVLLIDLFCNAHALPSRVCPACYDINQDIAREFKCSLKEAFDMNREEILYQNYKEHKIAGEKHNALYDAKVIRELYQILNKVDFEREV